MSNTVKTQLAIMELQKSIIEVFESRLTEGVNNLPDGMKEMLASDDAEKILNDMAASMEDKEDFDKSELIQLSAVFFTMAMAEEVLDEQDDNETA